MVAKSLGEDEERHGSVSFGLDQYFGREAVEPIQVGNRYRQWITLFDHPDDDIYDGILGEDDEEVPRVLLEFLVDEVIPPPPQKSVQIQNVSVPETAKRQLSSPKG